MGTLTVRALTSDDDIRAAFPVTAQLRDRIRASTFLSEIRDQQAGGYQLIGAFAEGRLVGVAGIRHSHTLARGPHLFVDDLVIDDAQQRRGYGRELLEWVEAYAAASALPRVYLDSRATARGFYEAAGYTVLTALPCWKDVSHANTSRDPAL